MRSSTSTDYPPPAPSLPVVDEADRDQDGVINEEEFFRVMRKRGNTPLDVRGREGGREGGREAVSLRKGVRTAFIIPPSSSPLSCPPLLHYFSLIFVSVCWTPTGH